MLSIFGRMFLEKQTIGLIGNISSQIVSLILCLWSEGDDVIQMRIGEMKKETEKKRKDNSFL